MISQSTRYLTEDFYGWSIIGYLTLYVWDLYTQYIYLEEMPFF